MAASLLVLFKEMLLALWQLWACGCYFCWGGPTRYLPDFTIIRAVEIYFCSSNSSSHRPTDHAVEITTPRRRCMYHRSRNIPVKTARYRCNREFVHKSQTKLPVYSKTYPKATARCSHSSYIKPIGSGTLTAGRTTQSQNTPPDPHPLRARCISSSTEPKAS